MNRLGFIGGSDIAIILGLSNYKTPYELWLEKCGLVSSDYAPTELQYWGKALEPLIIKRFAEDNDLPVYAYPENKTYKVNSPLVKNYYKAQEFKHPHYDFLVGHLDGYLPSLHAVLEVKCCNSFMVKDWGESGSDEIPLPYLVQVAFYCMLKNTKTAYVAVLFGGMDYREYIYKRNPELEDQILTAAIAFWHCVEAQLPPDLINTSDLRKMYPEPEKGKEVIATTATQDVLFKIEALRQQKKQLVKEEDDCKMQLMEHMKEAETLLDFTGEPIATWKADKKGTRRFLLKGGL